MNEDVVAQRLNDWIGMRGPARRTILGPLGTVLVDEPTPPQDHDRVVEPALVLLRRAGRSLPLATDGSLKRGFAAKLNAELGFDSPAYTVDGQETVLEIDALFLMLSGLGTIDAMGTKGFLTHFGRAYLDDTVALWHALASCLGLARPPGFPGELWELILGWLVRDDTELDALDDAVAEAAEAHTGGRSIDQSDLDVAFFSLYTFLRALGAFEPRPRDATGKPTLTPAGRATALEALRASVATLETSAA